MWDFPHRMGVGADLMVVVTDGDEKVRSFTDSIRKPNTIFPVRAP